MNSLYLIGVATLFIVSKFEDVNCITMRQSLTDVGHNKFTQKQIIAAEQDILLVLQFRLSPSSATIFTEASLTLLKMAGYSGLADS